MLVLTGVNYENKATLYEGAIKSLKKSWVKVDMHSVTTGVLN